MVATAILVLIMTIVLSVIQQSSAVWRRSTGKIEAFQDARNSFQILTRNLSQATLNTYYDYFDSGGQSYREATQGGSQDNFSPSQYGRQSELQFRLGPPNFLGIAGRGSIVDWGQAVFFQAPLGYAANRSTHSGLDSLLNSIGYFVSFASDRDLGTVPPHVKNRDTYRYRLMQLQVATENNDIYAGGSNWYDDYLNSSDPENRPQPIGNNIVGLFLLAEDPDPTSPLQSEYEYDSTKDANTFSSGRQPFYANQLPPVVRVTMVAIDEESAKRLEDGSSPPSQIAQALEGKFTSPGSYETDIQRLKESFNDITPPVNYRIFSSLVPLRASKWTKQ